MAAGIAIPGAGFLMNYGGKFKDGIMGLNNRIQNSDFGRSKNLMDYFDMRKYGGYDEREMARRINMDEAKLLQDRIDEGEFDGFERPTQTFSFDNSGMKPSNLNNLESLVESSQVPQQGIMSIDNIMDTDEIGKGADYVGYSPKEKAAIAAGTKTPKLEDLTDFINVLANESAMKRYLEG